MRTSVYRHIARQIANLDTIHEDIASDDLDYIEKEFLPSGSGFDAGTKIDRDESKPNRLVLTTSFHHINDNGYYDGWTEHKIIVTPCLRFGFDFKVTGRNRRGIKEYIESRFHDALSREFDTDILPR